MSVFRINVAGRYGEAVPGSKKRLPHCLMRDLYMKDKKRMLMERKAP